ncbi:MAG: LLM class flavin-dependent oxidoreductase, partial [Asgard group archaeon]|nr:LLM class flavin-dependent oxidoreductase [Asgard group archaeon]
MSSKIKYGVYIANFGKGWTADDFVELAKESEKAGWDGFFLWDHLYPGDMPEANVIDPFVVLAAIASQTKKIRIGTTVTPLSRRSPWQVARETATLDHLSNGRFILGVGLGGDPKNEFEAFGIEGNDKLRAEMLDESLDIIQGLWSGEKFAYKGKHHQIKETQFLPAPVQKPSIPIWVGGNWPNKPPFRRAARYQGVFPLYAKSYDGLEPKHYPDILAYIKKYQQQQNISFDVVFMTNFFYWAKENKFDEMISDYSSTGVNWFVHCFHP